MKNLLLTGSSGWLGRFLAPRLQGDGFRVIGLDLAPGEFTTVVGTVADRPLIDNVFAEYGVDAVIHCGALHKPDIARYSRQAFVDTNVAGTLNLLEAAVTAGHDRFVFTSTTSLMISKEVRSGSKGGATRAFWMDETFGPIQPRNIYGVTKYAAEQLCQLFADQHGLDIAILRTARFFPEDDDTLAHPSGPNLKANEFLHRRLSVIDAADAHRAALKKIQGRGCRTYLLSAPTPFAREDCEALVRDAKSVIAKYFPDASELYAKSGWVLPNAIERVYDATRSHQELGFRAEVDFSLILETLAADAPLPFHHDPHYVPTKEQT
ncbi:MAG: NAD(P)-dependent oxidoreductase [Planctomycetota bacterium]